MYLLIELLRLCLAGGGGQVSQMMERWRMRFLPCSIAAASVGVSVSSRVRLVCGVEMCFLRPFSMSSVICFLFELSIERCKFAKIALTSWSLSVPIA